MGDEPRCCCWVAMDGTCLPGVVGIADILLGVVGIADILLGVVGIADILLFGPFVIADIRLLGVIGSAACC